MKRKLKNLWLALAAILFFASAAQAAHFTVAVRSALDAETPAISDTAYLTFDRQWLVYDGTTWLPCPQCALDYGSAAGAGATQYNAGTAAGATDALNAQGCIRDDATTTLSDPDGDYVPCRVNARGAQWVAIETALDKAIDSVAVFGANATAPIHCTNTAFLNMTTATTTEIVALSGVTIIYVCGYSIVSEGDIVTTVKFVGGTGANCVTSQDDRSSGKILTAGATVGSNFSVGGGSVAVKTSTAGDALCVTQSGAANIGVDISYAQF